MAKGYPTPDVQSGDATFSCISVFVPSNPEFQGIFAAAIYGLYASMAKEYFWYEQGTMSAQEAAFLAARGLAASEAYDGMCGGEGEMSCEDIADCIETSEAVQDAITEIIGGEGFTPNPDTDMSETEPEPTLSEADKAQNLLPDGFDCDEQPQLAMGLARTIVKEMHESTEDFLELVEYATNSLEAWENVAGSLPSNMTSVIATVLDWLDWIVETFQELYAAAYTQDVEDELACAIFCFIMENCTLTINDLQTIYEGEATIGTPPDGLIEVLEFIYGVAVSADKIAVAAFHYQIIRIMAWGKFQAVSAPYLKSLLKSSQGADFSYEDLCEECVEEEPTDYWMLYYDFRLGTQRNTEVAIVNGGGNDGSWVGNGYEANLGVIASTTNENVGIRDLGGAFIITGSAARVTHIGGNGNASHDFVSIYAFENANYGGAWVNSWGQGAIPDDVTGEWGQVTPFAFTAYRSMQVRHRVNIATNASGNKKSRTYAWVTWGLAGAGDTKPIGAKWAGNTMPATFPEMFPDYVAP